MPDCLFCKIARKEFGSAVIYENGDVLAFLDINPRAPGHAMVVSRTHSETLLDLPDEALAPLFEGVKTVTGMLQRALAPDGFTIGINHGKASGQAVDHLHVHVIPRFTGDGGGSIHTVVSPAKERGWNANGASHLRSPNPQAKSEAHPPKEALEEMAARIRKAQ